MHNMTDQQKRCEWTNHSLLQDYHDREWGVPVHDDRKHFEFLVLDAFQAGLSWLTILKKRENFRRSFEQYDVEKIARYDERKIQRLLADAGIIRNQLKVRATIQNARAFLRVAEAHGSFDQYIWHFVDGKAIQNHWHRLKDLPMHSRASDAMSKDLKSQGFTFVGSTICYSYMQAAGLVNDHVVHCFRYKELGG